MRHRARALLALLALVAIAGCQLGEGAAPRPMPPTAVVQAPTPAPPTNTPGPTALPSPGTGVTPAPGPPIAVIAPIDVQVPAGFKASSSTTFAAFRPPQVQTAGRVEAPAIAPDLSNVELTVLLAPEQRARIAQNGFAVSPGQTKEFYELYERARYDYVPVFVTSDSLLHVYHLLFDKTLRRAEVESFIPMLARLDWELLRTSARQYEELAGTPWAEAARRNAAYFAVAVKILTPDWEVPAGLRDLTDPDRRASRRTTRSTARRSFRPTRSARTGASTCRAATIPGAMRSSATSSR